MAEPHIDLGEDGANMSRSLPGEFAHIMSMLRPTCASDVISACHEIRCRFAVSDGKLPVELERRLWETLEELTAPHYWYAEADADAAIRSAADRDRLEEQCDALMGVIELYGVRPPSPEASATAGAFVDDIRRLPCELCQRMADFIHADSNPNEEGLSVSAE